MGFVNSRVFVLDQMLDWRREGNLGVVSLDFGILSLGFIAFFSRIHVKRLFYHYLCFIL